MLTDSGGFQVWSLGSLKSPAQNCADVRARHREKDGLIKIDDEGVNFTSHIDGKKHRLTPEDAIRIQQDLGADIIMAFDEATPDTASYSYAKEAMGRTHQWARRCLDESARCKMQSAKPQLLFGIIQGGRFKKLRQESARFISSLAFDGIAIGGESIGFKMKRTVEILTCLQGYLNKEKPIYTMGVGFSPSDFFEVVENGVDMFDCVAPARLARHGSLYCRRVGRHYRYRLNIFNAQYQSDPQPICDWCDCAVCQTYSRSYLRHLFKSKELTALRLATIHNLRFMLKVMEEIRESIKDGVFRELKKEWF
jgi:tRNA-guanine transglycosylase